MPPSATMKRAVRPRRTFLAKGVFRVVASFSVMSNVPLRVCLHGIRSSLGPSGPGTTGPEFYATPSNKGAKLPKAVMPQSRGDGVKAEGQQVFFGELLAACLSPRDVEEVVW